MCSSFSAFRRLRVEGGDIGAPVKMSVSIGHGDCVLGERAGPVMTSKRGTGKLLKRGVFLSGTPYHNANDSVSDATGQSSIDAFGVDGMAKSADIKGIRDLLWVSLEGRSHGETSRLMDEIGFCRGGGHREIGRAAFSVQ